MRCAVAFVTLIIALGAASTVRAEAVETEIQGVTAELVELRQHGGVLRLAVRFRNVSSAQVQGPAIQFGDIVLLNPQTKQKFFGIKDADGRYLAGPVSDANDGGRWRAHLAPQGEVVLWLLYEPVAAGSLLTVQLPLMFPFDDVPVTEGANPRNEGSAVSSTPTGLQAKFVSAKRADGELKVRLKLESAGTGRTNFNYPFMYQDVYALDPVGKRRFGLMKDSDGQYIAQPKADTGDGGRLWLNAIAPGSPALMSLTFAAPPDDVTSVDLILPWFVPFEAVALVGEGGASAGGVAAAGRAIGIEAALKELQAVVTPMEIAIDLSADVLFDFDKADLKPAAAQQLGSLLAVVNSRPAASVLIEGHTDVRGEATYNQALSQRRAEAVLMWLIQGGVPAVRLSAIGAGETRPVRSGETEADHQANRRVEIRIRQAAGAAGAIPSSDFTVCRGADAKAGIAACTRIIERPGASIAEVADAYATRAKHHVTEDDLDRALADASEALRRNPTHADALHNRSIVNLYLGRHDAALADLSAEIRARPEPDAEAYASRARVYAELGRLDEALQDLAKALEIHPAHVDALISRGAVYLNMNRLDEAIADLNRVVTLDDANSVAFLNRGVAYLLQKRFDLAITDFDRALTLEPGNADLHFQRAIAYSMSGRAPAALADAEQTLRTEPNHLQASVLRAGLLEATGKPADALAAHRRVLELDPSNQKSQAAVNRLATQ